MSDPVPFDDFDRTAARQLQQTAVKLRQLADRLEQLPRRALLDALPIAAWGVEELERRLEPWMQQVGPLRSC